MTVPTLVLLMVFGVGAALTAAPARQAARARHYRWRNRRFLRQVRTIELRSRQRGGGSGEDAGSVFPRPLPAAGGDARPPRPVDVARPPAPCSQRTASGSQVGSSQPLAGAVDPRHAAPARPTRVLVSGAP